jgi:hypothetical protein
LDRRYEFRKCCYRPGDHTILFALPPELRSGTQPIDVTMTMGETFVPAAVSRDNGDRRSLAAIFVGVDFRQF